MQEEKKMKECERESETWVGMMQFKERERDEWWICIALQQKLPKCSALFELAH